MSESIAHRSARIACITLLEELKRAGVELPAHLTSATDVREHAAAAVKACVQSERDRIERAHRVEFADALADLDIGELETEFGVAG